MEEVNASEGKSMESSLYITAMVPELSHQISIEDSSENSIICEKSHIFEEDVKNPTETQEDALFELQEEEKTPEEKPFEDLNLTETLKEPVLPVVSPEETCDQIIEEDEKKDEDKVLITKAKMVYEGIFGSNSYFVYEIHTWIDEENYKVNRRYRDFEWLYKVLKENYKGMSVPPLPSKTLPFMQDSRTADIRKNQLEKCLQILLRHGTLKKSKQLYFFLTSQDIEFSKIKENMKIPSYSFKYNDLEDAIDQIISKIQAKMNQLFSLRILPFSKDLVKIDKYLTSLQVPSYSLSTAFLMVVNSNQKSNFIIESMHFTHSNDFHRAMQLEKHELAEYENSIFNISNHLCTETLKIEALKGAIEDYKNALKKYSELETLIERKALKAHKSLDDSERYLAEIEAITVEIKDIEKQVSCIEGNIKSDKIWFQAERDEQFENIVNKVFEVNCRKAVKEEEFWLRQKHSL
ncbi:hypothetical protein SteCoe_23971 [Stentor coeruleus]|uniref:PX domain-containing protein n=1 Tax=Stentor coeruleus TaxID=5963 RepID=A0A1R2BIP7_9CILI|nr:hypothetical protein SteCoe_23971 [Stentor coeruleus]